MSTDRPTRKEAMSHKILHKFYGFDRFDCCAAIILIVSLILKIALISKDGPFYDLNSDDRQYLITARTFLQTGIFTYVNSEEPTVFIMPAYPLFIAAFMKLLGYGTFLEQTLRIVQVLLASGALWLLYRVGKRLMGASVALTACAITAFYLPLWLVSLFILTEALFFPAVVCLAWTALRLWEYPTQKNGLIFGLAWATTTYIRPTLAPWPMLFFAILWWKTSDRRLIVKPAITACLTIGLAMTPWWVRNYQVTGRIIPLTLSSGNPLLIGTFPKEDQAEGFVEVAKRHVGVTSYIQMDKEDHQWAMERIRDGFCNSFRKFAIWYGYGKFRAFWQPYDWKTILKIPNPPLRIYHQILVILGFIGMWMLRKTNHGILFISMIAFATIVHMVFLGHGRYSSPLVPFVLLFTAYAIQNIVFYGWSKLKKG